MHILCALSVKIRRWCVSQVPSTRKIFPCLDKISNMLSYTVRVKCLGHPLLPYQHKAHEKEHWCNLEDREKARCESGNWQPSEIWAWRLQPHCVKQLSTLQIAFGSSLALHYHFWRKREEFRWLMMKCVTLLLLWTRNFHSTEMQIWLLKKLQTWRMLGTPLASSKCIHRNYKRMRQYSTVWTVIIDVR